MKGVKSNLLFVIISSLPSRNTPEIYFKRIVKLMKYGLCYGQRWPRYVSKVPRYRYVLLTLQSTTVSLLGTNFKKYRLGTFVMFVLHICASKDFNDIHIA